MPFRSMLSYYNLTNFHFRSCYTFFKSSKCLSSSSLCKTLYFSTAIISRFTPVKRRYAESFAFLLHFRTSTSKYHRLLVQVCGDSAILKPSCINCFLRIEDINWILSDKQRKKNPRGLRILICRFICAKMIPNYIPGLLISYSSIISIQLYGSAMLQKDENCVLHDLIDRKIERP